jgi:hypothetical protein
MGDGKLLEEATFRNCQFLQVGRAETVGQIIHRARRTSKKVGFGGKPRVLPWADKP